MIQWDREKILVSMRFNVLYSLEGSSHHTKGQLQQYCQLLKQGFEAPFLVVNVLQDYPAKHCSLCFQRLQSESASDGTWYLYRQLGALA